MSVELQFVLMSDAHARAIAEWHYDPPYSIYSMNSDEYSFLLDPQNNYYAILSGEGELTAFCCVGIDARVPGGSYIEEAADIGLGIRPDLTGQGLGSAIVDAIVRFVSEEFKPPVLRLTVAAFNLRAIKVYSRAGFVPVRQFTSLSGLDFLIMLRQPAI